MTTYRGKNVLVVGLGKTGAACVRWFVGQGAQVTVTDSRRDPPGKIEIRGLPAQLKLGAFAALLPLKQYALAAISPGISLDEPFVRELRAAGVPTLGDIELFARAAEAPVLAITGSNGKSTVTTLVGEIANHACESGPCTGIVEVVTGIRCRYIRILVRQIVAVHTKADLQPLPNGIPTLSGKGLHPIKARCLQYS